MCAFFHVYSLFLVGMDGLMGVRVNSAVTKVMRWGRRPSVLHSNSMPSTSRAVADTSNPTASSEGRISSG